MWGATDIIRWRQSERVERIEQHDLATVLRPVLDRHGRKLAFGIDHQDRPIDKTLEIDQQEAAALARTVRPDRDDVAVADIRQQPPLLERGRLSLGVLAGVTKVKAFERDTRRFDAVKIADKIKGRVFGQDRIADTIASFVARKAARRSRRGTIANILISGPTGSGKTEMAKAVSEAVFGSEDFMLQVDCGTMGTSEQSLASLVGAPSVYQGSTRGALADYLVKTKGDGVILFDEYEKAAPSKDAPLDMSVLDATGCVVILTSNLKQKQLADHILLHRVPYHELGAAYLDAIDQNRTAGNLKRRLERLGYVVTVQPKEAFA